AVPARVDPVDAIPLTANGKADVAALHARARTAATPAPARRPATGTERRMRDLWQELLGAEDIGPDDTFFGRGGHSLQLVALQLRLRAELGVDVPVVDLMRHTTLAALARHLDGLTGAPDTATKAV
ncbi:phosphopantetheine-binding protein, partial [Streptomyces sp. SID6139]|nr:thioester reductase [Streptomyces sp. SID6139]